MTRDEKAQWDHLRERKADCDREIAELGKMLSETRSSARKQILSAEIDAERKLREMIAKVIPDSSTR